MQKTAGKKTIFRIRNLYVELMAAVAVAGIAMAALCLLLFWGTNRFIASAWAKQNILQPKNVSTVADFQEYVTQNGLASTDAAQMDLWVRKHSYVVIGVQMNGSYTYDSSIYGYTNDISVSFVRSDPSEFTIYHINFTDGTAKVYYYGYFEDQMQTWMYRIAVMFSILAMMILLLLMIRKKIRYIHELNDDIHILEGGNLEFEVPIRGKDELASLAESLNAMRRALSQQMENERSAMQANSKLVTALSHDLRTPLTTQMGYLEILKEHHYENSEEREHYLDKCLNTCNQIKLMSDRLFEYFLASGADRMTADGEDTQEIADAEDYDGLEVFMQLITEHTLLMEGKGFHFDIREPEKKFLIHVNMNEICRVFNNIFSNLEKYADPQSPVRIIITQNEQQCSVSVENHIAAQKKGNESSKVGLESIRGLMRRQHGSAEVRSDRENFEIMISLPVRLPQEEAPLE